MNKVMSTKVKISLFTAVLMIVVLYFARNEIVDAWHLLFKVDLRIIALLFPLQFLSYYATGATSFSYLRQKGGVDASPIEAAKIALELNFVNHILPSGGVSGASYMTWRLKKLGVGSGRGTLAQAIRILAIFMAYTVLLVLAVVLITIDGNISRFAILVASGLVSMIVGATLFVVYIINSRARLVSFSTTITKILNKTWRKLFKKQQDLLKLNVVVGFFEELHDDFVELKADPKIMKKPFAWALLFNICEIAMFCVAFWAVGSPINPAPLVIAYGLATIAGLVLVTPGGAGGYEALMIGFLASSGINQAAALAAIVLTRVLLIVTTILSGYVFYQMAITKYGKNSNNS